MEKLKAILNNPFSPIFFLGISYLLVTLLMFPSYIYIYRSNLAQDKETPVFYIVSHFYGTNKKVYIVTGLVIISLFGTVVLSDISATLAIVSTVISAINMFILYVITQANHFLLSILALQRFFIYFLPDLENHLSFTKNSFKWVIRFIYFVVIFLSFAEYHNKFLNFYLISNIFLLLAICLYIPITLSIRRFNFLPSSKLNSPEKYVLWQLVSIVVFKFSYLFIIPAINTPQVAILTLCRFMDCFSIPLIIEISYFGSNRRNMKKLISTFKFWNYCRKKTDVVSADNSINPSSL